MKKSLLLFLIFLGLIACTDESTTENGQQPTLNQAIQELDADSLQWINKQIIANPNNLELYLAKARYFLRKDQPKEALKEIQRCIESDSTQIEYKLFKADILYDNDRLIEAQDVYLRVLEIDDKNIHANTKIARIKLIAGNHEECFIYANIALKENPYLPEPYYLKGLAYKELGNFKQAVSAFRTATEQDNDFLQGWLQLGYMYDAAEDTLASAFYKNALRIDSNDTDALYALGVHYQNWRMPEKAITTYHRLIQANSGYQDAYYNLGYVYLEFMQQNDSAIKYYDKVIALNPFNHKAYYNKGLAFERLGNKQLAYEMYQESLKLKPDFTLAAKGISRIE